MVAMNNIKNNPNLENKYLQQDFFNENINDLKIKNQLKIMPISVLEISAQKKRTGNRLDSSRSGFSPFAEEVSDICYEFYLRDSKNVFDPFAGWGERAEKAKEWNKNYIGFDTSKDAIMSAKKKGFDNVLANSLFDEIPKHDGLITCPPYWNLEKYSGNGIDQTKTWEDFIYQYTEIWKRCYEKAEIDSTYCIMVGEWRKNHVFYDLEYITRKAFKELGATLFDQVVISRKLVSKVTVMMPQAKRLGYSVRVHESLLIFKKQHEKKIGA